MAGKDKAAGSKMLRIKQIRSGLGRLQKHRRTLRALGIRRHQQSVIQPDSQAIRGMIAQVEHLVEVRPVEDEGEE